MLAVWPGRDADLGVVVGLAARGRVVAAVSVSPSALRPSRVLRVIRVALRVVRGMIRAVRVASVPVRARLCRPVGSVRRLNRLPAGAGRADAADVARRCRRRWSRCGRGLWGLLALHQVCRRGFRRKDRVKVGAAATLVDELPRDRRGRHATMRLLEGRRLHFGEFHTSETDGRERAARVGDTLLAQPSVDSLGSTRLGAVGGGQAVEGSDGGRRCWCGEG